MKIVPAACLLFVALATLSPYYRVDAKSPNRPSAARPSSRSTSSRRPSSSRAPPPVSRRRAPEDDEEEEEDDEEIDADFDVPGEEEENLGYDEEIYDDEEEEDELRPVSAKNRRSSSRAPPPKPSRKPAPSSSRRPSSSRKPRPRVEDYEDDYDRPPPRRSSSGGGGRPAPARRGGPPPGRSSGSSRSGSSSGGRRGPDRSVVPYGAQASSTFTRGLTALREHIPDPSSVRDAAAHTLSAARQTTTKLSSNIYREVKGLTSSELEQVMLKATRPDDTPVKGKHAERLVGVTYQISARYDIYDAVLRKLWGKMAEKDWRTTVKALYILHRFSADGAPEHQAALKARLRELRRTKDPKRKDKYFNSKQLLAGDTTPENVKYRAFLSRYAHYVLLRAQCFGGMFDEISHDPSAGKPSSKKPVKPVTSTALRTEHLEAATILLKAGVACSLKEGEECENTAIAVERVASDLIGLTTAVAIALNRALKGNDLKGADPAIIKRWCEFYSEDLLPQTKSMVKKTSAKLDAYGLFLPSRMGASVSQEVLQKGLKAVESEPEKEETTEDEADAEGKSVEEEPAEEPVSKKETVENEEEEHEVAGKKETEEDEDDEYDYEEEEYYDDEDA